MATTVDSVGSDTKNSAMIDPIALSSRLVEAPIVLRLPNRSTVPQIKSTLVAPAAVEVPSRRFTFFAIALSCIALGVSGYLAFSAYNKTKVAGCGGGEIIDCNHVLNSRWSTLFGMPVSVPALAMYCAVLVALTISMKSIPSSTCWSSRSRLVWGVVTVCAVSAGLAALWFTGLQVIVIGKLCPWCLVAHTCGLCLAGAIIWKRPLGAKSTAMLSCASVVGIAVLISGQLIAGEPEAPKTVDDAIDQGVIEIQTFPTAGEDAGLMASPLPAGDDSDLFSPPGDDLMAAPGVDDEDDFFAPPQTEDTLFAPPGIEAEVETDESFLFEPPPVAEESGNDFSATTDDEPTEEEIFGGVVGPTRRLVSKHEVFGHALFSVDDDIDGCQIIQSGTVQDGTVQSGTVQSGTVIQNGTIQSGTVQQGTIIQNGATTQSGTVNQGTVNQGTVIQGTGSTTVAKPIVVPTKPKERIVSVSGGTTRLNVRHWPLIGDPTAKYIFVEMFDYTCPHCRETHKAIHETMKKYGDQLAVVSLPVPLETGCNPAVRTTHPQHFNACRLAIIAVATWRCNPKKFTEFHDWMFVRTRTPDEAMNQAAALVGFDKLNKELSKPYAKQYIDKHVKLYQRAGSGAVPKLMFPGTTFSGKVSTTLLNDIIRRELSAGQ